MTKNQIKKVLMLYRDILKESCVSDIDGPRNPEKLPERYFDDRKLNIPWTTTARHVAWMCNQAWDFAHEGETEKAMRWLGFIQGYLWCESLRSINQMRDDNR